MLSIITTAPPGRAPGVVLTCTSRACQHTFEPDPVAFAAGGLACPRCAGWTFQAVLAEPATEDARSGGAGGEVR